MFVDLDDFSEDNNRLDILFKIKKEKPNFKVTLFTVPAKCSKEFCKRIAELDWIQLALHGEHHSHLECSTWTKEHTIKTLEKYEKWGCFQKIFKPPYWAGSDGLNAGLKEKDYILAQNKEVDYPRLYLLNKNSLHGHIQNVCGNGLEQIYDDIIKCNSFEFISDFIK
jgi:hypothetical protein